MLFNTEKLYCTQKYSKGVVDSTFINYICKLGKDKVRIIFYNWIKNKNMMINEIYALNILYEKMSDTYSNTVIIEILSFLINENSLATPGSTILSIQKLDHGAPSNRVFQLLSYWKKCHKNI